MAIYVKSVVALFIGVAALAGLLFLVVKPRVNGTTFLMIMLGLVLLTTVLEVAFSFRRGGKPGR